MWTWPRKSFRSSSNSVAVLDMLRRYFCLRESAVCESSFLNVEKELPLVNVCLT